MCDYISESLNNNKCSNFFIKLLMLRNMDEDYILLYGFCVPTSQPVYQWKYGDKKARQSIWTAILSHEEATAFFNNVTAAPRVTVGCQSFTSSGLIKRPVVLSYKDSDIKGPVSDFCRITEYWNVDKNGLLEKIKASFGFDGKELYRHVQGLLEWACDECGIDFSKNPTRIGNFEFFDLASSKNSFVVKVDKALGGKKTTVFKRAQFSKDLIVNCTAEHRGRIISDETKMFRSDEQSLEFFADEPMSRVITRIWDIESGELIFSDDFTLCMGIHLNMNIGSPTYQIHDPWSDKLFKSAANRSDIIKNQIQSVSRTTHARTVTMNSGTYGAIDKAIDDSGALFSGYQKSSAKGAFIPNIQKDGEINSFLKIREYIEQQSVNRIVIADPYFSVISAQKLLTRISNSDIQLDIITSLADKDPDTNKETDICKTYRKFLADNAPILHNNLSIRNLTRGKDPVFHDRYLIRYFEDGRIDGFLLSNSLNSMGQFYPFVIAPMEQEVCYEVCGYLEAMCDAEIQAQRHAKERIAVENLCDFRNESKSELVDKAEQLPADVWLAPWYSDGAVNIPEDELTSAVNAVWMHWEEDKSLTCKMLGFLALNNYYWHTKDLADAVKNIDSAEIDFCKEFIEMAKEKEKKQNHISKGLASEAYKRRALLSGQAEPSRQGFSKLFDEAGHVWYDRDNWLGGGYAILLWVSPTAFIKVLDEIKSPLMFDVLATQMQFCAWDEALYNAAIGSNNLCVRLLCGEYAFCELRKGEVTITQIEEAISKLPAESSGLQLAYMLSQLVFHVRTTRSKELKEKEDEINAVYGWMLEKLADDLLRCNEDAQSLALYWLHDCEACSDCKLHLDLASVVADDEIKAKLYKEVIAVAEHDLISTSYSRDISEIADLYLQAMDSLFGDDAEQKLLKFVSRDVFETATDPALRNYDYSKWSSAYTRAKWQIYILERYISTHSSAQKSKKRLEIWKPRINVVKQDIYNT